MGCKSIPIVQNAAITQFSVAPSATLLQQAQQMGIQVQAPPPVQVNALVDTGCSLTAVSGQAAQQAGLLVIGQGVVQTANGQVVNNLYFGDIKIAYVQNNIPYTATFHNRTIAQYLGAGPVNDALLGMDLLNDGVLVVDGTQNMMTFCW
ncbi:MAG TPA: aspartyl protease family protein [Rhizomicrobium sp.]|nr:aspartyl protease family protein [Rhizomicrobium sp.]